MLVRGAWRGTLGIMGVENSISTLGRSCVRRTGNFWKQTVEGQLSRVVILIRTQGTWTALEREVGDI